ncbi:hemolysin [Clostridia bacterium]|nr:hemolysin [Clostridia bacterium]
MSLFYKLKDPVSSLSHMLGAILALPCAILMVILAHNRFTVPSAASFAIFGAALILLYTASSVYHGVRGTERVNTALRKFDHMAIFVLIAGTYTPVCAVTLANSNGPILLTAIWASALAGIALKAFWITSPKWLSALIYVAMGWGVIFALYPLYNALPKGGLTPLLLGGLSYTIGAVIYSLKVRLPFKNVGCHEIFHILVLIGSAFHVYFIFRYVLFS